MASLAKVLAIVVSGQSDTNVRFNDLRRLLRAMGFSQRIKGGHFIFSRIGVVEIINLQPLPGGKAKPYQVKQVRGIITAYKLSVK